jgi:uncharacterized YccA/Bax inhibitor family protein
MKRFFILFALLLAPLAIFAQEVEPPANWGEVIMNPAVWFSSLAYIAALTAFLAAFLNGLLKVTKRFVKQLVAWGVGIILLIASNLLNFGYAAEQPILLSAIHGFAVGLVANGIFDIPVIKSILETVEGWFKKE